MRELVRKEAARIIAHADVTEIRKKTETTGCLVAEFVGDIPLDDLEGQLAELIRTLSRLPKTHGTAHGKNRFKSDGPVKSKLEEIREADGHDQRVFDALSAEPDLTEADRRARLADRLVPRVTVNNLKCHLDGIDRILRAAEKDLGYSGTGDKVRRARSGTELIAALADPTDRAATNYCGAGAGSVTLLPSLKKLIYPS